MAQATPTMAAGPVSAGVLRLQVPSPLAAYEPTPMQAAQVKYLVERLTQVCMRGFGLVYAPELSTSTIANSVLIDQEFQSRVYGVSDLNAVSTYGYHLPPWTQGTAAPDLVADIPADELSVLEGTGTSYDGRAIPAGGCDDQAVEQLSQLGIDASGQPGGAGVGSLITQIQEDSFEQAQSDPRVLAVFGKWSACMLAHGDDYQTPFTAAGDSRWSNDAPTAGEISIAKQDIACKTQVNLVSIDSSVVADYQNTAIAENAMTLTPVKSQVQSQGQALQREMARYGG